MQERERVLAYLEKLYISTHFVEGDWTFQRFARNLYKVFPHDGLSNRIVMTGADKTTEIFIPFPFRWLRVHIYHTDNADSASSDALNLMIKRLATKTGHPSTFSEILFATTGETDSWLTVPFGIGFEYEAGIWQLTLNSTNTDRVYPVLYLQKMED